MIVNREQIDPSLPFSYTVENAGQQVSFYIPSKRNWYHLIVLGGQAAITLLLFIVGLGLLLFVVIIIIKTIGWQRLDSLGLVLVSLLIWLISGSFFLYSTLYPLIWLFVGVEQVVVTATSLQVKRQVWNKVFAQQGCQVAEIDHLSLKPVAEIGVMGPGGLLTLVILHKIAKPPIEVICRAKRFRFGNDLSKSEATTLLEFMAAYFPQMIKVQR